MAPKQRRKILLINKKFQLRFSFYVVSWILALSISFPLIIYRLFEFFIGISIKNIDEQTFSAILTARKDLLVFLIIFQLAFMLTIAFISLFVSHRISGPLHKLKVYLDDFAKGIFHKKLKFREGDYFREFEESYNNITSKYSTFLNEAEETSDASIKRLEAIESTVKDSKSKDELAHVIGALKKLKENIQNF